MGIDETGDTKSLHTPKKTESNIEFRDADLIMQILL